MHFPKWVVHAETRGHNPGLIRQPNSTRQKNLAHILDPLHRRCSGSHQKKRTLELGEGAGSSFAFGERQGVFLPSLVTEQAGLGHMYL